MCKVLKYVNQTESDMCTERVQCIEEIFENGKIAGAGQIYLKFAWSQSNATKLTYNNLTRFLTIH